MIEASRLKDYGVIFMSSCWISLKGMALGSQLPATP